MNNNNQIYEFETRSVISEIAQVIIFGSNTVIYL